MLNIQISGSYIKVTYSLMLAVSVKRYKRELVIPTFTSTKESKKNVLCYENLFTADMPFLDRNSRLQILFEILVGGKETFTGKRLYWSLFLIKLQAWGPATLLKRDTNTLSCEYCEISKNSFFFVEHLWWLLSSRISSYNRKKTKELPWLEC